MPLYDACVVLYIIYIYIHIYIYMYAYTGYLVLYAFIMAFGGSSQSHREDPYSPHLFEVVASIALLFLLVDDHSSRWLGWYRKCLASVNLSLICLLGRLQGLLGKSYIFCLCGPFVTWIILDPMAGLGSRTWLKVYLYHVWSAHKWCVSTVWPYVCMYVYIYIDIHYYICT